MFLSPHCFFPSVSSTCGLKFIYVFTDSSPFPQTLSLIKAGKRVCFVDQGMPDADQNKHI